MKTSVRGSEFELAYQINGKAALDWLEEYLAMTCRSEWLALLAIDWLVKLRSADEENLGHEMTLPQQFFFLVVV